MVSRYVCLALLSVPFVSAQVPPNIGNITLLVNAAEQDGAVSLDGSPAALYIREEAERTKFYIYQQGGGWCGAGYNNNSDCYERSLTSLGSSRNFSSSMNLGGGYLSNDPAQNPMMWNWTKVYLPYTDGGSQTGDVAAPIPIPGHDPIFFRGHRILKAVQSALIETWGLGAATDVVISGCSAGGLSTYLHADSWAALLPHSKVVALPDSGFFLDFNRTNSQGEYGYGSSMRTLFAAMNSSGGVPQACVAANAADPARCIFAEHVSPYLATPFFALQSEFDAWQIAAELGLSNATTNTTNFPTINEYGRELTSRILQDLVQSTQHSAIFLDSCYHHCGGWNSFILDGANSSAAFQTFYEQIGAPSAQRVWAQDQTFPCASCCSP